MAPIYEDDALLPAAEVGSRGCRVARWWVGGADEKRKHHPALLAFCAVICALFVAGYGPPIGASARRSSTGAVAVLAALGLGIAVVSCLCHFAPGLVCGGGGQRSSRLHDLFCPGSYELSERTGRWHIKGDALGALSVHVKPPWLLLTAALNIAAATWLPVVILAVGFSLEACKSPGGAASPTCAVVASGNARYREEQHRENCGFLLAYAGHNVNQTDPPIMMPMDVCFKAWYDSRHSFPNVA